MKGFINSCLYVWYTFDVLNKNKCAGLQLFSFLLKEEMGKKGIKEKLREKNDAFTHSWMSPSIYIYKSVTSFCYKAKGFHMKLG